MNYYNEINPFAAAWLRNLIAAGLIPDGFVDTRSIEDVRPDELQEYTQCHFFAGIGGWSLALRNAGWPDSRPVWTGSCPCQPFSAAGKGAGFADERHLWPAFHHHIAQHSPPVVFGEQVASQDGLVWLDLVQTDMEGSGYAFGALDLCAAGVGAPHIRQRLYWVADADYAGPQRRLAMQQRTAERAAWAGGMAGGLGLSDGAGRGPRIQAPAPPGYWGTSEPTGFSAGGLADSTSAGRRPERQDGDAAHCTEAVPAGETEPGRRSAIGWPGPVNGHWGTADWLYCTDGKWRPVEPGTFPLAHGIPSRVGRLRAYGNAIVAPLAEAFITAYLEAQV